MKDRAVDTRNVVLIQKSLVAINDFYILIIGVNEFVLLADIVKVVLGLGIVREVNYLLDKVLVPSLSVDLCPNLFGCHVHDMEDVGSFLWINGIVRSKHILVRGKGFDLGAANHFASNRNGSLTVFA